MLVYFTTLFIVVLTAYLSAKSKSKFLSRCLLSFAFITMVLVGGLRDKTVGTDTPNYVSIFSGIRTFAEAIAVGSQMGEYGFWLLTWLLHFISDEYVVFLMAIAIIVVSCYQWILITYSAFLGVSFFVFITLGSYTFFFNGARQGIACAISVLAIAPLMNRNLFGYVSIILFAFLFHKTALIMLPVYFIFNRPNTFKNNIFMIIIGISTALFYDNILALASKVDTRYADSGATGEGGGYYTIAFDTAVGMFFLIYQRMVQIDRTLYDRFLNIYLFGVMLGVVSSIINASPSGFLRLGNYFLISSVFLWPIVFLNVRDKLSSFVIGYLFCIIHLLYFTFTMQRWSNLVPYIANTSFFR